MTNQIPLIFLRSVALQVKKREYRSGNVFQSAWHAVRICDIRCVSNVRPPYVCNQSGTGDL